MTHILSDVDGVLLDWSKGFTEWMGTKDYKIIDPNPGCWGLEHRYGLNPTEMLDVIFRFNESAACGYLESYRDADPFFADLYHTVEEQDPSTHVVLLTAFGTEPHSVRMREELLRNLFPSVPFKMISIEPGRRKKKILAEYAKDAVCWVEDHPMNAKDGADLGIPSFLMSDDMNQDHTPEGVTRVKNWSEIHQIVWNNL